MMYTNTFARRSSASVGERCLGEGVLSIQLWGDLSVAYSAYKQFALGCSALDSHSGERGSSSPMGLTSKNCL